jgi:hypothetical protein
MIYIDVVIPFKHMSTLLRIVFKSMKQEASGPGAGRHVDLFAALVLSDSGALRRWVASCTDASYICCSVFVSAARERKIRVLSAISGLESRRGFSWVISSVCNSFLTPCNLY